MTALQNPPTPYEIRLVVQADPAAPAEAPAYLAHWQDESGSAICPPFALAPVLSAEDREELRWYLEEYMLFPGAGDRQRAGGVERQLREWGQALFAAAFGTPQAQQIYSHMQQAERRRRPCRITLGCDIPAVLQQPWELLYDARGPLAFRGITVRRQLPESQDYLVPLLAAPLRVLLIVSRPEDVGFIDPRNSIRPLLEAINALPNGLVQIDFCEPPTFARLEELVGQARRQSRSYHIVHFDGHGTYLPETGVGALVFEDDSDEYELVSGRRLGELLSRLQVPLVLLEACRSADLSAHPPHESVAPALLQAGVGSVVAFSHAVHVEAARLLVERFYQELASGRSVGQALDEARVKLHAAPRRWLALGPEAETIDLEDWFILQLYQVGPDPELLGGFVPAPGAEPALAPADSSRMRGFPPPPRYRFQGRAQELLRLERDFRQYPAVLLSGMGGMGKTALAREAASWWLQKRLIDEAVFVSLEQRPPAERVVQLIGVALEGEQFNARGEDERWAWVVQAFRSRRMLLVWDNAESVLPQFQAGLEGDLLRYGADDLARLRRLYLELTAEGARGRLLITCRPAQLDWAGLKVRPLRGLARADSHYVLRAVLERHAEGRPPEFSGAEREALDQLLDMLGDHPLSIELVGPQLLRRPPSRVRAEFGALLDAFASAEPEEERNRSLRASLAFSLRHLSEEARGLLPWLAWFSGGVLENQLRHFMEKSAEELAPLRAELVSTALIRLEEIAGFNSPYWQLHPTLPYAARPEDAPDPEAAEQRFIAVYFAVGRETYQALRGQDPAFGMALLGLEEANYRAAMTRAFRRGERQVGWALADTLREYLGRAGRQREQHSLAQWARSQIPDDGGLDEATCESIRQHAWALFAQGQAAQAVQILQNLLNRLEQEGVSDEERPARQQALTLLYLGRVYDHAGRPDLALASLQQAVALFEQLGEGHQDNLASTLGDLANAHQNLGQNAAALSFAEQGLAINRRLGRAREIAIDLGIIAQILAAQQRYAEADARYEEALQSARQTGDRGLEGTLLQHQGILQDNLGNYDQAVQSYQQAMRLFQQAGDLGSEMRTSDLLGTTERQRGNVGAARGWYERARELAIRLNDRKHQGVVAQNLGILYLTRAEQESDPARRAALLGQAEQSVQESLRIKQERQDQVGAASSFSQLGVLYRLLGNLDQAEAQLEQARAIYAQLDHPMLYMVYGDLALVAQAHGDPTAAAGWQIKSEAKEAELVRRRGTDGRMPPLVALEPLLRDIAAVTNGDAAQRAEIEELLPQLEQNGWLIGEATQRLWAGERDLTALVGERQIDIRSLALIARTLQFVADPDAPPLLPDEEPAPVAPADDEPEDRTAQLLRKLDPLLRAVAAIAAGDTAQQLEVEEALAGLEKQGFLLREPARRIWAGERDPAALCAGLDETDAAIVARLLAMIAGPGAPEGAGEA